MKHLLTISLLFLTIFAYAGEWNVVHQKADELLGNSDYDMYIYTDGNVQFGYSTLDSVVCVLYKKCVFDCEYSTTYSCFGEYVMVGLYSASGELIEKGMLYMSASDKMDCLFLYNYLINNGWSRKIILHLRTNGYVRIVADTYSCKTLDVKIPGRRK